MWQSSRYSSKLRSGCRNDTISQQEHTGQQLSGPALPLTKTTRSPSARDEKRNAPTARSCSASCWDREECRDCLPSRSARDARFSDVKNTNKPSERCLDGNAIAATNNQRKIDIRK